MNITVQSKTLEVTDALRAFCEKQAQKMNRFGRRISSINIHIENIKRKKNDPSAASVQYSVKLPGNVLVVKRTAVNMYEAVVDATNGIMRQVRKTKEKRITKKRN
jgi:ribosomal subunit interface protein